jgi:WD40 repeat protein
MSVPAPDHTPILRVVPLGEPLNGPGVRWGVWGRVAGRPVLATGGSDGSVIVWDAERGTAFENPLLIHDDILLWGRWGNVGGQPVLAIGDASGMIMLRDALQFSALPMVWTAGRGPLYWATWGSVRGHQVLAVGGSEGTVLVWDPDQDPVLELAGHVGAVSWGAWGTRAGRPCLATGGEDHTVRLWDIETGSALGSPLLGHTYPVRWGVWGQIGDRPVLATGGGDGAVWLWDVENGVPLREALGGFSGTPLWGAWGQVAGRPVLATGDQSTVRLWDIEQDVGLPRPLGSTTQANLWGAWARVGDRPLLATGGYQGAVRIWDAARGTVIEDMPTAHFSTVLWGSWGQAGDHPVLATGGDDRFIRLWEVVEDRPVPRLPTYRSDVTVPIDELSRLGDAVALAELVTAKTAAPPLAIGLFGDWGEGKSHFLGLLQEQVAASAHPDNPLSCSAVRQVRFNAWHYAETDLWASLVAELFAQLAVPPDGDVAAEQRRQSRLVADVVAQRGLPERLRAARQRRDELQAELQRAEREDVLPWRALDEEQRQQLERLAGPHAERYYQQAVRTVAGLGEARRNAWQLLRSLKPAVMATLVAVVLAVAAAAALVAWYVPSLVGWSVTASVVTAVLATAEAGRRIKAAMVKYAGPAWHTAVRLGEGQLQGLQTAADVADAEVAALENEIRDITAAGQLAGLVAERASTGSYRGQLGVMTQIRQDFARMAALLAQAGDPANAFSPGTDAVGDELPKIDRIVLYIDDLDRCPPHRVVEMLEAIQLLLAISLFVTVVAVDPRWLLRAITLHYHDILLAPASANAMVTTGVADPDDQEMWHFTPAQYLEKIFQLVLTLPPLDTSGYQRLLRTLVTVRQPLADPDLPRMAGASAVPGIGVPGLMIPGLLVAGPAGQRGADDAGEMFGVPLPTARSLERIDPLILEPDELALLDLLGPPLLVSTPRAVKRLANSYGLLIAMRRDHRTDDLEEQHGHVREHGAGSAQEVVFWPYRAGLTLLAALIAFPHLGPALFLHLHHTATDHPYQTWEQFLDQLYPSLGSEGWYNAADPAMTPVQAQQWQALLDGLRQTSVMAAEHDLPLPKPLSAWEQWVVPVGRLSFPTGHIISTLDRQRPLSERPLPEQPARSHNERLRRTAADRADGGNIKPHSLNGQNCTVVATDVLAFGRLDRTDSDRQVIRAEFWRMTRTVLDSIWASCWIEDRGDGVLIAAGPDVPTSTVMKYLVTGLPSELREHNRGHNHSLQFQARVAVDVAPVVIDSYGISSGGIGAMRLVDAPRLKSAIAARSDATIGVIASDFVYQTIMTGSDDFDPNEYTRVQVNVKEMRKPAWMRIIA